MHSPGRLDEQTWPSIGIAMCSRKRRRSFHGKTPQFDAMAVSVVAVAELVSVLRLTGTSAPTEWILRNGIRARRSKIFHPSLDAIGLLVFEILQLIQADVELVSRLAVAKQDERVQYEIGFYG
jgi:hypothetical protein